MAVRVLSMTSVMDGVGAPVAQDRVQHDCAGTGLVPRHNEGAGCKFELADVAMDVMLGYLVVGLPVACRVSPFGCPLRTSDDRLHEVWLGEHRHVRPIRWQPARQRQRSGSLL